MSLISILHSRLGAGQLQARAQSTLILNGYHAGSCGRQREGFRKIVSFLTKRQDKRLTVERKCGGGGAGDKSRGKEEDGEGEREEEKKEGK